MAESFVKSEFGGLLVKVSANVGSDVGGKLYLIPKSSLSQFEFAPERGADFDAAFADNKLINVDYAAFRQDFIFRGSSG
jgi:hypothetical protein